jgi:hypothetical protein
MSEESGLPLTARGRLADMMLVLADGGLPTLIGPTLRVAQKAARPTVRCH